jgi:type IV secretory pathway TraG/TraD family ATPase VirD4
LRQHPDAAPGWAEELAAQATADPRQRDGVWGGVRRAFDCLADPRVLAACSPKTGDAFNAGDFLRQRGTLYLLGSTGAQVSVAPLVSALVEDLVETARRAAAASRGGRLDPPLTLWLDEAANIAPIASLPSLLADGGGVGITTIAVLQSQAQARARWQEHAAGAMWDAATIKIVFGGLAHADDLSRISRLTGEADHTITNWSGGPGGRSWSQGVRRLPVLAPEALRNLPEGRAVVLHRRTPPIEAALPPWWEQPIAAAVRASLEHNDPTGHADDHGGSG